MSTQQLGHSPMAIPPAPEPSEERNNGSALSHDQEAGFSESRSKFPPARTVSASRAPAQRDSFGLQLESRSAKRTGEHRTDYETRLPHRLASRPPATLIESMARRLLANGRVLAARKLVDGVPSGHVAGETLRRLRVALAEPVVRRTIPAEGKGSRDIEWLRRHAHRHTGQWVALVDGELVAADASLAVLRRRLRRLAPTSKPLLHRV